MQISVIGSSEPAAEFLPLAREVGRVVAARGAVLICGGLGGMMEAASRGAKENSGVTVGILPDYNATSANPYIDIVIPTGLGHARNVLVVASGDIIVALMGSHGTRAEIAIALKLGKPVIGVGAWDSIPGVKYVRSIEELQKELVPYF
ncbi:MAG: TIGR00725 family protein [Deltaproteobacteria bacterium]|nr:TIGR00725 family protein [Deltaproteobacteria bacterium]